MQATGQRREAVRGLAEREPVLPRRRAHRRCKRLPGGLVEDVERKRAVRIELTDSRVVDPGDVHQVEEAELLARGCLQLVPGILGLTFGAPEHERQPWQQTDMVWIAPVRRRLGAYAFAE